MLRSHRLPYFGTLLLFIASLARAQSPNAATTPAPVSVAAPAQATAATPTSETSMPAASETSATTQALTPAQASVPQQNPSLAPAELPSTALTTSTASRFANPTANLVYALKEELKIKDLKWTDNNLAVQTEVMSDGGEKYFVTVRGSYAKSEWKLFRTNEEDKAPLPISTDKDGNFSVKIIMDHSIEGATFSAISPEGEIERETVALEYSDFDAFKELRENENHPSKPSKFKLNAGLGLTYIDYHQPDGQVVSETNVTGKGGIDLTLVPKKWSLGANGYLTMLNMHVRPAANAIKFIGGNIRLGYQISEVENPWTLIVMGGFYYTSCWGGSGEIGYTGVGGPQIFPVLTRALEDGRVVSGYFKLSPMANGFSILNLSSSEIAAGLSYGLKPFTTGFFKGTSLAFSFDWSWLRLQSDIGTASSKSYTVGTSLRY